jgi:hypothetical protein
MIRDIGDHLLRATSPVFRPPGNINVSNRLKISINTLIFLIFLLTFKNRFANIWIRETKLKFTIIRFEGALMYSVYPVPGTCPVCHEGMIITRLHCPNCDVTVEGRFTLGRLAMLSPEQLEFVEVFLRCDGKIKRVEDELGVSYPTVRSRLNEVITAMGYEAPGADDEALLSGQRRQVLDDLAAGRITSQEAVKLLQGT